MKTEFREIQRFTQWWLWLILLIIVFMPFSAIFKSIVIDQTFLNNPLKDLLIVFISVIIFLLIYLFSTLKLITIITNNEVIVVFKPFITKIIKRKDIESMEIIDYGFAGDCGIKYSSKHGDIYKTSGRIGLAIKTIKGEKLVIGTRKQHQLKIIINEIGFQ